MSLESLLGDSVDRAPISPQLPALAKIQTVFTPAFAVTLHRSASGEDRVVKTAAVCYLWVAAVGDVCSMGKPALRFQGLGMRGKLRP